MRGIIIEVEKNLDSGNTGLISGSDNIRYRFKGADWQGLEAPLPNDPVDFIITADQVATAIYPLSAHHHRQSAILAVVCRFFGVFGVHRFMVGKIGTGLLMLSSSLAFLLFGFVMISWGGQLMSYGQNNMLLPLACQFIGWCFFSLASLWSIIDLASIITGVFVDKNGEPIREKSFQLSTKGGLDDM